MATLSPIHRTRLRNLKAVIDAQFKGNASNCARAIERSHTFMWQLVNERRSIGEKSARHIEKMLRLGANALDASGEATTSLSARDKNGATKHYLMVPMLSLDALDAKPAELVPCPVTTCSDKTFAASMVADDMAEVEPGDVLFCDADKREPQLRSLYVVTKRGKPNVGIVLAMTRRSSGWTLISTSSRVKQQAYPLDEFIVKGRVMVILRVPA